MPRHQDPAPTLRGACRGDALIVGVTGHRPHRLVTADLDALRQQTRGVLTVLLAHAAERGVLALSPLAAGADQLIARVALEAGCHLVCPLPFTREAYARDFTDPDARAAYSSLLARADKVIELDGSRATPARADAAYAAVGAYIVERAAVLLAIWDGKPAQGPGGTAQVAAFALAACVPVIRVDAHAPHTVRLLVPSDRGQSVELPPTELPHVLTARGPSA